MKARTANIETPDSAQKPDRILYYEALVSASVRTPKTIEAASQSGFTVYKSSELLHYRSANRDNVVEALGDLCKEFKKLKCNVAWYQFGAVYVDSNNWDTLDVLGNDPHADKR